MDENSGDDSIAGSSRSPPEGEVRASLSDGEIHLAFPFRRDLVGRTAGTAWPPSGREPSDDTGRAPWRLNDPRSVVARQKRRDRLGHRCAGARLEGAEVTAIVVQDEALSAHHLRELERRARRNQVVCSIHNH